MTRANEHEVNVARRHASRKGVRRIRLRGRWAAASLTSKIFPASEPRNRLLTPNPSACPRAIARQRPRTHSEARCQRRRHIVKLRIAIRAAFHWRHFHAQPVPARGALWIHALHRPARQKYHVIPRAIERIQIAKLKQRIRLTKFIWRRRVLQRRQPRCETKNLQGFCAAGASVSRGKVHYILGQGCNVTTRRKIAAAARPE